jgi:hypothetical protein
MLAPHDFCLYLGNGIMLLKVRGEIHVSETMESEWGHNSCTTRILGLAINSSQIERICFTPEGVLKKLRRRIIDAVTFLEEIIDVGSH